MSLNANGVVPRRTRSSRARSASTSTATTSAAPAARGSANCTSGQGTWQAKQLETRDTLEQDFPAIPIYSCSIAIWTSGHYPALALDGQGRPRVVFVAKHQYAGTDTRPGHAGQACQVHTDITLARFSMVQP